MVTDQYHQNQRYEGRVGGDVIVVDCFCEAFSSAEALLSYRIYCLSNIVQMPLTQCHFSHWHTHSLSVLPSFLIIPAPSAM